MKYKGQEAAQEEAQAAKPMTEDQQSAQNPAEDKAQAEQGSAQAEEGQTPEGQASANALEADAQGQEDPNLQKLAAAQDKYLRLQAEFDNYRKRTARERMELVQTAGQDIIKGMLPVLDDCEHALAAIDSLLAKEGVSEAVVQAQTQAKEGVELIARKLFKYLETQGVKQIEAKGQALDTDLHAAVAQFPAPSEDLKGKVVEVVQQGYTLHGKVIRFAQVVVGL